MKKWVLIFLITLLLFYFFPFKYSLIFLAYFLIKFVIYDLGIFRSINFTKIQFPASEIFYIEYIGDYYQIHAELEKIKLILKKFTLDEKIYSICGIYYDNLKKMDVAKSRAVIGII